MGTNIKAGGGVDDGALMKPDKAAAATGNHTARATPALTGLTLAETAELLRVTLSCIGDGVITTDRAGRVNFLNPIAQQLTGWTQEHAAGEDLTKVFHIVNEETRAEVDNPALRALKEGVIVGLANHTLLIARDGTERPIDDSAAPIKSVSGETAGSVLVFRDVTEHKRQEKLVRDAFDYAQNILGTLRHPFLVLDKELRVVSANRSFYTTFRVEKETTEGRFVYDLGHGQWNIPALRTLLEEILPKNHSFEDFEVEHEFPSGVGQKTMLLNARRIRRPGNHSELILLAIEDITERKLAEKLAKDAFDYASNILDTQREPFLVLDKALRVVSANSSFYKTFHVEKDATEGRFVYNLGDGQWDIPKLRELLEEVLPQKNAFEGFEVEHDFPGGVGQKTMLINARRIRKPGDDSELILLAIEDITERKLAKKLTKDAFDYASNILDTQREPFLVLDKDLRVTSANSSFYKAFHVEKDTTVGRFVYDLGDGQWNIPKLRELLEKVLPQNDAFDGFEVEHDFPGGVGEKTMLINARRIRKPGENSELILLAIEDITERKRAQQAHHESELRFRRLFETSKDGVIILDAYTGKITDANAFMCGLTGMESGELVGKELHEIGMYKDVEENKESFRELQRTGYLRHDHLPVHNRRGEKVEVEFIANVYHEGDKLVAQCNVRDIAERSRLEKELAVKTDALAVQSRGKDEFLAMLSHELRNPLAPIRAAVHLLKLQDHGNATPIQHQARDIIERQVASLTRMVSDLLEVSRVVSGRIQLDMQPVDVKLVVEHALQTAGPLFEQRQHMVVVTLCPEAVWGMADATRLEEVLVNLLNNAAKYTPDRGRIEVAVCTERANGAESPLARTFAVIRVIDNGVGIDGELLPRIFDLFTQADRSLARSSGGLGIGLSLAHRLVNLHGGTIAARSDGAGLGSEFTVKLPLVAAPLAEAVRDGPASDVHAYVIESVATGPGVDGKSGNGRGVRVLVVDDNVDLVLMVTGTLRHKGYTVRSAFNGPDGLKIAQEWRPDIALLDIGLPGLDGYEVARRLRSDATPGMVADAAVDGEVTAGISDDGGGVTRIKLIALTGYGRDADIVLSREAGFDGHMVKPCDFDELEKMMDRLRK